MKRFTLATLLLLVTALAIGCSGNAVPNKAESYVTEGSVAPAAPPVPAPRSANSADDSDSQSKATDQAAGGEVANADANRMIVYTGDVSLQVNDTQTTVNQITDLLAGVNGYIASKSLQAYGKDKLRGTISIRLPAATLDSTLKQIKALGVKVLKEDASSNDVTEEYTDLDARRTNLEAYEVELQKLLETVRERTGKAEDILAVYNQLTEVRGQIEQIKGRQRYLENTSTLATYTIELVPVEEVVVTGQEGWNPGTTLGRALDSLIGTLQGLADLAIIFVVNVVPILLIFAIPIVAFILIVRALVRRHAAKKPVPAA